MDGADLGVPGPAAIEVRLSQDSAPLAPSPTLGSPATTVPTVTSVDERQISPEAKKTDPPR